MFMMGLVNRFYTEIIRDPNHPWSKWLVSYEELPRDEVKFPGNSTEYYPDYIVGWLLITNPGTSARIVEVRLCFMFHLSTRISDLSSGGSDRSISLH